MSIIKTVKVINSQTGDRELVSSRFALSNGIKNIYCQKCGAKLVVRGNEIIHPLEKNCPLSDKISYWFENKLDLGRIYKKPKELNINKLNKLGNLYIDNIDKYFFIYKKSKITNKFFLVDIQEEHKLNINPVNINGINIYNGFITYLKQIPIKVAVKKLLYLIMVESNGVDLETNPITGIDAIPFISKILDIPFEIVKRYI